MALTHQAAVEDRLADLLLKTFQSPEFMEHSPSLTAQANLYRSSSRLHKAESITTKLSITAMLQGKDRANRLHQRAKAKRAESNALKETASAVSKLAELAKSDLYFCDIASSEDANLAAAVLHQALADKIEAASNYTKELLQWPEFCDIPSASIGLENALVKSQLHEATALRTLATAEHKHGVGLGSLETVLRASAAYFTSSALSARIKSRIIPINTCNETLSAEEEEERYHQRMQSEPYDEGDDPPWFYAEGAWDDQFDDPPLHDELASLAAADRDRQLAIENDICHQQEEANAVAERHEMFTQACEYQEDVCMTTTNAFIEALRLKAEADKRVALSFRSFFPNSEPVLWLQNLSEIGQTVGELYAVASDVYHAKAQSLSALSALSNREDEEDSTNSSSCPPTSEAIG